MLNEALDIFVTEFMPARNYAMRTRVEYARDLIGLVTYLANKDVTSCEQVTLRNLYGYIGELDRCGLKPASRNRKTDVIRVFFKFLQQQGFLKENIAAGLVPNGVPAREVRFLTEDEYSRLLAQIHDARDRAIAVTFLQTGVRLLELAKLSVSNLELPAKITRSPEDTGIIKVQRRSGKGEVVPLNWKACEALYAYLRSRPIQTPSAQTSALFLNKRGTPLSARSIERMVSKYLTRAGVGRASVQSLRHTMATHYVARGGDLKAVQHMLGHENIVTTEQYVHLAKKVQRKMVQDLAL